VGGSGGFSAFGGPLTVNIGGSSAPLVWAGTGDFLKPDDGITPQTLYLGSAWANNVTTFQNPIDLNAAVRTIYVNQGVGGDSATMSGALTGTGSSGLLKNGAGTLALSNAANSYAGATTVRAGNLVAGANAPTSGNGAFGNSSGGAIAVGDASTGGTDNLGLLINGAFTVGRNVTVGNYGNVVTLGGTNTSGTATFGGTVALSKNVNLTAASGGTVTFSNAISGSTYGVTKVGNGTVVLTGTNSYTGATTVKAGVLFVNTLLSSTSGVTVESGATLGGTGTISAPVTDQAGAFIAPGASIGTLTLSQSFTLHGEMDAEIQWTPTSTSDVLAVTGGNLVLDSSNSVLNVIGDLAGAPPFTEYTIATVSGGGTVTGTFKTVKNNGTEGLPPMWTVQYNTTSIKVIPEPATMALLGLGAVAMLFGRRRRNA
jgi:autotransporter-associated beta strand protein